MKTTQPLRVAGIGAGSSGTGQLVLLEKFEEGYISAKMCLAAQESIETKSVVEIRL